ncbi:GNAT family N-acetyltransferase [Galbibacter sp. EGI 63066]|uniref:GNAT family N-acetyltransferase n=1 Tax=Galbibacter sp. EGI 63066 TaxID=2993559 RepID=UPI002249090E|nr:GNAT family N-acetyltransferase [Galbibacter sp. EGI 63066]MCX2680397.1 GNAT family N-acetyltransferase [Galbibacter sp. EGI 63066]
MAIQVQQEASASKGRYFVEEKGKILAEMTYSVAGSDKIIIDHTDVDDSLRGKGVGQQMVKQAVDDARENNIKILPLCPFAKSQFDKHPEYADVLV